MTGQILEHTGSAPRRRSHRSSERVVVSRALSSRWKRYLRDVSRCRKKCSEESIHDLRVSLRRLIAVLELTRPLANTKQSQWLRKRLKKQFDACGPLRDIQVQILGVKKLLPTFPSLEPLLMTFRQKETRCIKQVTLVIHQIRLKRIEKSVESIMQTIRREVKRADVYVSSVGAAFDKVRRLKQVLDRDDTETIHALRIAFKKFRYQAELMLPLLPWLMSENLHSMHEFQTRMGEIQDVEVLIASVNKFTLKNRGRGDESFLPVYQELQRQRSALINCLFDEVHRVDGYWPAASSEGSV